MYHIDFNKPNHVHFIGIGGISMSGLAEILLERGFTVSGSDAHESELTDKLESHGAKVFYGQKAENIIEGIDLVVYTAAIHPDCGDPSGQSGVHGSGGERSSDALKSRVFRPDYEKLQGVHRDFRYPRKDNDDFHDQRDSDGCEKGPADHSRRHAGHYWRKHPCRRSGLVRAGGM